MAHLALASSMSLAWAFVIMRLLKVRSPRVRALLYAITVIAPLLGFVSHLLIRHDCEGLVSVGSHFACAAGTWLGTGGTVVAVSASAVLLSQALASWGAMHRVVSRARRVDDVEWNDPDAPARVCDALARAVSSAGIRMPDFRVSDRPGVLCTVGITAPVILMSKEFCEAFDHGELAAALSHEVGHIANRDNRVGIGAVLMRALSFYSPAAHYAVRGYLDEREKAADDYAVGLTKDPLALASAIVKVAKGEGGVTGPRAVATMLARTDTVVDRVERLLSRSAGNTSGTADNGSDVSAENGGIRGEAVRRAGRWMDYAKGSISVGGVVAIVLALC